MPQESTTMPRRLPPGCVEDCDRHGTVRIYYRAKGRLKVRLRGTPWTPEFMMAYEAAKGVVALTTGQGITPGTWRWLCIRYFVECTDYKLLDEKTQRIRRWILEATYDEPIAPGSPKLFKDFPLSRMTTEAIEVLRDRKTATPEAANHRVKAARAVFKWGVRKKGPDGRAYAPTNPARDVPYLKTGSTGYHSWTADEVRQFEARHPIGTKARLALALLLLTGQRRSDVIRFGRQHIQDGRLVFTQFKGRNRKPKRLNLPILPALQRVIDASPCGDLTFLVNDRGHPFPDRSFGNKFRAWSDQADLPHCTAHGLRKAGATIAAEAGATAHQLMAIFGWSTIAMAQRYTQAADQKRLADGSMHLLETAERMRTESSPTHTHGGTFSTKP
jgi:integrase